MAKINTKHLCIMITIKNRAVYDMKYMILLSIFVSLLLAGCSPGSEKSELQLEVRHVLEQKGYHLGIGKGEHICCIVAKNLQVTAEDLSDICALGSVTIIQFRNSDLRRGAIRNFKKCDKLKRVEYSRGSTLPLEEVPDHDLIPALTQLDFKEKSFDDSLMPHLAKLRRVKEIVLARTRITNDGFKKFVELHEGSQPSRFQIIENPFLDDALLDILVAYEGLEYVDFGSRSKITRKGVNQFYVDYYKKHKVMLNLVHGL